MRKGVDRDGVARELQPVVAAHGGAQLLDISLLPDEAGEVDVKIVRDAGGDVGALQG
jgi:hypothetical protein